MVCCPDLDRLGFFQGSQLLVQLAFEPAFSDTGDGLQGIRIKPVQMKVISLPGDELARTRLPTKLLGLRPHVAWQHNHGIPGSIRMGLYRDGLLHSDLLKIRGRDGLAVDSGWLGGLSADDHPGVPEDVFSLAKWILQQGVGLHDAHADQILGAVIDDADLLPVGCAMTPEQCFEDSLKLLEIEETAEGVVASAAEPVPDKAGVDQLLFDGGQVFRCRELNLHEDLLFLHANPDS